MHILKQSTASQEICLGYFISPTDGSTLTGLTITSNDLKLFKEGATTRLNASVGATHLNDGTYYAVLGADDTDTLGNLLIMCHPTGALPVQVRCLVVTAAAYAELTQGILAQTYEGTNTVQKALSWMAAVLWNKSGGSGTGTLTFRNDADTQDSITVTSSGNNRTAVSKQ